jgi:alkylation response protein AidB-like acyl-CoA dehydrogenase
MRDTASFIDAAKAMAPQIQASAEESERTRRLPMPLVEAMARAGLFRLWIPRALGGEETDPMTLVRVIEAISQVDGATGWCLMIGSLYGLFGGCLPAAAAHEIYGRDPLVITGGAFRSAGQAIAVDGGYRVTGRWAFGSGCQHSVWIVGGCRIFDGDQPRFGADGTPAVRILFFPAADCEILDTWQSVGLRGTGSHDYAVTDLFVPAARSLSFREPPVQTGPLYALPVIALFAAGISSSARHSPACGGHAYRTRQHQSRRPLATDGQHSRYAAGRSGARGSLTSLRSRLPLRDARRGMGRGHRRKYAQPQAARHAVARGNASDDRRNTSGRSDV